MTDDVCPLACGGPGDPAHVEPVPVVAPQLFKNIPLLREISEGEYRVVTFGDDYAAETYSTLAELKAAPSDPDRDARREAYRADQRRKAARALDRLIGVHLGYDEKGWIPPNAEAAADRFVEAVGDYVLSRLHHNSHYGVPDPKCIPVPDPVTGDPLHAYECTGHHKPHYGAAPDGP